MKARNCRKCGWANLADARFCGACGARLELTSHTAAAPMRPPTRSTPARRQPTRKSPAVAALLNAIPFPIGLGYVYVGRWWRVAGSLFARAGAFVIGIAAGMFVLYNTYHFDEGVIFGAFAAFLAPQVIVHILVIWDAWRIADDHGLDDTAAWGPHRPSAASPRAPPFSSVEMEVAGLWRG